jgi:hypothetical protein
VSVASGAHVFLVGGWQGIRDALLRLQFRSLSNQAKPVAERIGTEGNRLWFGEDLFNDGSSGSRSLQCVVEVRYVEVEVNWRPMPLVASLGFCRCRMRALGLLVHANHHVPAIQHRHRRKRSRSLRPAKDLAIEAQTLLQIRHVDADVRLRHDDPRYHVER